MVALAKRFGATGPARRESGTCVTVFNAILKAGSANKFVQEAGIETVACPNGIYGLNGKRGSLKAVFAAFGECALRAALNDNGGNKP